MNNIHYKIRSPYIRYSHVLDTDAVAFVQMVDLTTCGLYAPIRYIWYTVLILTQRTIKTV